MACSIGAFSEYCQNFREFSLTALLDIICARPHKSWWNSGSISVPQILVFNSNIGIDTKENHLQSFICLKSITVQILMLMLMLGFPNITPISDAMRYVHCTGQDFEDVDINILVDCI